MAQVDNDSPDPEYAVETETTMAHEYQDSFRITGLEVTKEGGYEATIFGTPASSTTSICSGYSWA